jgi:hypothetical protein
LTSASRSKERLFVYLESPSRRHALGRFEVNMKKVRGFLWSVFFREHLFLLNLRVNDDLLESRQPTKVAGRGVAAWAGLADRKIPGPRQIGLLSQVETR